MRIAHFGTFDVENYGDLLLPLVLERRLEATASEIVHVSPVGGAAVWADARPSLPVEAALDGRFDAVVVGGGHIVHAEPTTLERYAADPRTARLGYAALWLGATDLAARLEVPLVWNAPGVPRAFPPALLSVACWAAAAADHLSVRDPRSLARLRGAGFAGPVEVVLDTAAEVAELWTAAEREAAWREAFSSRGRSPAERSIVFHLNARYVGSDPGETAACVERIAARWDALPILVALGPCHGDDALAAEVAERLGRDALLIDRPRSLREVAACIERSSLYVGSSLHGLITAAAFGRPGIVIGRESEQGAAKFSGFLDQWLAATAGEATQSLRRVDDWAEAERCVDENRLAEQPTAVIRHEPTEIPDRDASARTKAPGWIARWTGAAIPRAPIPAGRPLPRDGATTQGSVAERLDAHWSAVERALGTPLGRRKSRHRGTRRALESVVSVDWSRRLVFEAVRAMASES
jgi:hypothetical protein